MKVFIALLCLILAGYTFAKIDGVSGYSASRNDNGNRVSDFVKDNKATAPLVVILSWDFPTLREDGSPLPLNEIKEYRIYEGGRLVGVAPFNVNTLTLSSARRNHYYTISTVDTDNLEGEQSTPIEVTLI